MKLFFHVLEFGLILCIPSEPSSDFNVELHSTKLVCHFVLKLSQLNSAKQQFSLSQFQLRNKTFLPSEDSNFLIVKNQVLFASFYVA